MPMIDPADWYRLNYPLGPVHNDRCLAVLCSLAPIYRLPIVKDRLRDQSPLPKSEWDIEDRERLLDGGISKWGEGLRVLLQGPLSTFDFDELTRLVVAAHQHHCRIQIDTAYDDDGDGTQVIGTELCITPRVPASVDTHLFARHPGLDDLIARATEAKAETTINPERTI